MEKGIYGETATKNYQWEREFVEKSGQKNPWKRELIHREITTKISVEKDHGRNHHQKVSGEKRNSWRNHHKTCPWKRGICGKIAMKKY